ncbi:MAG: protein translocase subunit SecF [Alphaproteobacteria bacterium]|nr:MAG: protein translocase subunit SecF [Alphaproteobacteria bacterium]
MSITLIPYGTKIDFVRLRFFGFSVTILLMLITIGGLVVNGLNLGIDFKGGILVEARAAQAVDMGALRSKLEGLNMGPVELQQFGTDKDVLIRLQRQPGAEAEQNASVAKLRESLGADYEYRRVEMVGPRVGDELFTGGMIAIGLALLGIGIYVATRFEWQFGVAALVATFHDVLVTLGLYSITGLEFNLTAVAALLTLAGFSVNDTVVVFDRMREIMRRQRTNDMTKVINDSVNQTLSRTVMTSGTVLVAMLPLLFFGGSTLINFTAAMTWGVLVGTFSSIYVAGSLLLYMKPMHLQTKGQQAAPSGKEA